MPTMPTPSSAADGRSRVRLQLAAGCVLACVLGSTLLLHESEALRKHRAGKALRLSGGSTPARSSAAGGAVRLGGGGGGGGGGGTPARASAATGSVAMEAVVVAAPGSGSGTQVKKRHQGTGWEYWEFRPAGHEGAQADRKWPLIVFLHGAGESGHNLDDMISIGASGCPPVELANGSANAVLRENFVVASPQTARGWGDAAAIAEFTRGLVGSAELAIDPARVYCKQPTKHTFNDGNFCCFCCFVVFCCFCCFCFNGTLTCQPAACTTTCQCPERVCDHDARRRVCMDGSRAGTGVSMGGAGAWVAGTTELFAAIAPGDKRRPFPNHCC
jgi:hypothetical protein